MADIGWADFTVLATSLTLSIATGIYHAMRSRSLLQDKRLKSAKDEYLMGSRQMPLVPVALSLLTTFNSGILMLGAPAEIFQRGVQFWLNMMTGVLASLITAAVFLPIFYKMRVTCLHEYFVHRYDSVLIQRVFSLFFLLFTTLYMAIVIYAPSVALASLLGMRTSMFIIIIGTTTTLYTTVGGLKAVVWTDSLQAALMYGGVLALIVLGLAHPKVGGLSRVITLAIDSGRITDLLRIDPNPAQYNTLLTNVLGGVVSWMAAFSVNQLAIQRYCSLPTIRDARHVIYATIVPYIVLTSIGAFIGLIALAYFYDCNPLETGEIRNEDQLIILFAKQVLCPIPGLFGLYIACVMSATLSTLSSGLNSMAAAMYEDFLKIRLQRKRNIGGISDRCAAGVNRILALLFGVLATAMAFACEPLGGIVRPCISVMGAMSGPFVGIFLLAIFVPKSGRTSALISFLVSIVLIAALCIWNYVADPYRYNFLPTNTTADGCDSNNAVSSLNITIRYRPVDYSVHYGDPHVPYLARISTFAYPFIGMSLLLAIGYPLSCIVPSKNVDRIAHLTFSGRNLPNVSIASSTSCGDDDDDETMLKMTSKTREYRYRNHKDVASYDPLMIDEEKLN